MLKARIIVIGICLRRILPQQKILEKICASWVCSNVPQKSLTCVCARNVKTIAACTCIPNVIPTTPRLETDARDVNQTNVFEGFLLFNLSFSTARHLYYCLLTRRLHSVQLLQLCFDLLLACLHYYRNVNNGRFLTWHTL